MPFSMFFDPSWKKFSQKFVDFQKEVLNQKSYGANLEETQTSLQQLVNPPVQNTIEPEFEEKDKYWNEIV